MGEKERGTSETKGEQMSMQLYACLEKRSRLHLDFSYFLCIAQRELTNDFKENL